MQADVLVVGAGNAAMCAALAACDAGADVLVLERAPEAERGGNTAFTAGAMRTVYDGVADLQALMPDLTPEEIASTDFGAYPAQAFYSDMERVTEYRSDPDLVEILVSRSHETLRWMAAKGIRFAPAYGRQAFKVDGRFRFWGGLTVEVVGGGPGLVETEHKIAAAAGARILYNSRAVSLLAGDAGIHGAVAVIDGATTEIRASAVVLACGGFQANAEWRTRYLGPGWDLAKVRGTRFNTGECLTAALRHGAAPAGQYTGCHATMVHASSPRMEMGDEVAFPHGYPYGITVNERGERFVDEGRGFYASTYASYGREVLGQPGNVAFQVFDAVCGPWRDTTGVGRYTVDHYTADTLEGLAAEAGIDPRRFVETVTEYNAAIADGEFDPSRLDGKSTRGLAIEKSNWALPLARPPFEAFPVECGLTFSYGGLATTTDGEVLRLSGRTMKGLYAVGEVAGSFFYNYLGGTGLIKGTVFGRRAGQHAAARTLAGRK
jgi:tricarballylate dehydrogenase